jgi:hypothetical protein
MQGEGTMRNLAKTGSNSKRKSHFFWPLLCLVAIFSNSFFVPNPSPGKQGTELGTESREPVTIPSSAGLNQEPLSLVATQWPAELKNGSETIAKMLEAVSGNPPRDDIRGLLRGVSSIERGSDEFLLQRADGQSLQLTRQTKPGLHLFNFMEQTERDASLKLGPEAARFVHHVSALSAEDNGVALKHTGDQYYRIESWPRNFGPLAK